jgi:hypothetical protein
LAICSQCFLGRTGRARPDGSASGLPDRFLEGGIPRHDENGDGSG